MEKVCLLRFFHDHVSGFGHMFLSSKEKLTQICVERQPFNPLGCSEHLEKAKTTSRVSSSPAMFTNIFKCVEFFRLKDTLDQFRALTSVWRRETWTCAPRWCHFVSVLTENRGWTEIGYESMQARSIQMQSLDHWDHERKKKHLFLILSSAIS